MSSVSDSQSIIFNIFFAIMTRDFSANELLSNDSEKSIKAEGGMSKTEEYLSRISRLGAFLPDSSSDKYDLDMPSLSARIAWLIP